MSKNLDEALKLAEDIARMRRERAMDAYRPYPKQMEFHAAGGKYTERIFLAGNRLGKSFSGAMEMAFHLTGEYPEWWTGRRWKRPITAVAAGRKSITTRDVVQYNLLGPPGVPSLEGTMAIPKASIIDKSTARGIIDYYDTIQVRHKSGGISVLRLKSYEQGYNAWEGLKLDLVWCDEEPEELAGQGYKLYSTILMRVADLKGMVYMTFTPLHGRTNIVDRFWNKEVPDAHMTQMTIDDVLHFTPEERKAIHDRLQPYEREAKLRGIPMAGEGRVFETVEANIEFTAEGALPGYWPRICGVDFGAGGQAHPFAAVWLAWDRDADVLYVYDVYRDEAATSAVMHASAMKPRGRMPVAWPHDGHNREKGSGESLKTIYKAQGLAMLDTHAQFPDGTNSVEAGILEMRDRFMTGRLKVAKHLQLWFDEYRGYHRSNGEIVKVRDDLLDATRYAMMARRFAKVPSQYDMFNRPKRQGNNGTDFWDFVRG